MSTIELLVAGQAKQKCKIIVHEVVRNLRLGVHHEFFQRVPDEALSELRLVRDPQELRYLSGVLRLELVEIIERFTRELSLCVAGGWTDSEGEVMLRAKLEQLQSDSDKAFLKKLIAVSKMACSVELRQLNAMAWMNSEAATKIHGFDPWVFCFAWHRTCIDYVRPLIGTQTTIELTGLPLVSAVRDSYVIFAQLAKEFVRAEKAIELVPFKKTIPLDISKPALFKPLRASNGKSID